VHTLDIAPLRSESPPQKRSVLSHSVGSVGSVGAEMLHNVMQSLPSADISCHFCDCKTMLVVSHVSKWLDTVMWSISCVCMCVCRVDSMDLEPVSTLRGHSGAVLSLAISPTGQFCYSGGVDGVICCWNVPNICVDAYDPYGKIIHWFPLMFGSYMSLPHELIVCVCVLVWLCVRVDISALSAWRTYLTYDDKNYNSLLCKV